MIIIKSQDGRITEFDTIIPYDSDGIIRAARKTVNALDIIGRYESEKRAKEVMDMIENHINFLEHIKLFNGSMQYFKGKIPNAVDGLIFTMPKD